MLAYCLRAWSTIVGEAWWQELEAADHTVCEVRSQQMMGADAQLTFSFCKV